MWKKIQKKSSLIKQRQKKLQLQLKKLLQQKQQTNQIPQKKIKLQLTKLYFFVFLQDLQNQ